MQQRRMLAVTALDDLLADDLVFINQIGQYRTKADDLAAHSSRLSAMRSSSGWQTSKLTS
jgi:hypothetical protein